ncbi:MAG: hypothetical protein AAGG08_08510 [Actinomycetota bacterium]
MTPDPDGHDDDADIAAGIAAESGCCLIGCLANAVVVVVPVAAIVLVGALAVQRALA